MSTSVLNDAMLQACWWAEQVYHELVVLERLHTRPQFSPGASLEGLTRPPLRLH